MKSYQDRKNYWISTTGFLGKSFSFQNLDLEIEDNIESLLDNFLKSLSIDVRVKLSLFQEFSKDTLSLSSERIKAIKERGYLKTKGLIHFEHKKKVSFKEILKTDVLKNEDLLTKKLSEIHESIDEGFLNKIKAVPISSDSFKDLYGLYTPLEVTSLGLKSSKNLMGVLKLKNSGNYPLSLSSLALMLEKIPKPFGVHISFEKMSHVKGEKTLHQKSKEEAEGKGLVSFEKYKNTQKALSDMELSGEELFHYEAHITLKRLSEAYLRRDIAQSLQKATTLGEWVCESFGAYPSLLALSPGSPLLYKLIEKSSTLKCFLPFLRFGASLDEKKKDKGSLVYHRRDLSLDEINPFSKDYANHTGVIIGKSGKGKSVFANLLTKSLFHDEKAHIFLVDVRGSHKKTVERLFGKTYNLDIKNPCGLNPLKNLTDSKESIEITGNFIEKLFLEEKESSLPSQEKILLEKNLIQFSKSKKEKNLDNLYKSLDHPRADKLLRWTKGSLNENIFNNQESIANNRLIYFNFENISTASNSYVAKAIIANIMAEFSFKLLNKNPNEKFIFISDETPFFIKNCFNTFSLLSKNVRKLNGSLILLAQNSKDLIYNNDTSLIDNSEFKILFSYDGEERRFKETFSLTENEFQKLKTLRTVKGEFSQFLLKDSIGSKVGFLRLSKEEYVLSNTEPDFLHKVQKLKNILNISEEKALKVMNYV
ncbi:MAG: hypothetical protein OXK80_05705 [Bdellovibrionales bacterium]|nr:hypothetical protein [Bdellovibrionales bacterium]